MTRLRAWLRSLWRSPFHCAMPRPLLCPRCGADLTEVYGARPWQTRHYLGTSGHGTTVQHVWLTLQQCPHCKAQWRVEED